MESSTAKADVRFDIPIQLEMGSGATIAGRRFDPDPRESARWPSPTWVFATHGAGGSSRYFDMQVPGREKEEYSFASYMTGRGIGVVAVDQLSMGDSQYPFDPALVTLELIALANHQAAASIRAELAAEAGDALLFCGLGHSAGGGITIIQQAQHRSFDVVAILGMPADDFQITGGTQALIASMEFDERGYFRIPNVGQTQRDATFGPGVPDDVVAAFHESVPSPPAHPTMMTNGTLAPYARKIDVPVLIGLGAVDLAGSPLLEPGRYAASRDVTLAIQPGCGHCHWAGERRAELWSAIANWLWGRARYGTRSLQHKA